MIGTDKYPPFFREMRDAARMATAYHNLTPYPLYGLKEWVNEERGPLPRCLPLPRWIVDQGAAWLFGRPLSFRCDEDEKFAETINDCWAKSRMASKSVNAALIGGQAGGVLVGFSLDINAECPITLSHYHPFEQARIYFDSQNSGELAGVRLQYPFYDNTKGQWFWHRQDWTKDEIGEYEPMPMPGSVGQNVRDPYSYSEAVDKENWPDPKVKPNPMGVLPFVYIRNTDYGGLYGEGDLWRYFQLIDLYNCTLDLENKDNQKRVDPETAYIDLQGEAMDDDVEAGPGAVNSLRSTKDKQGKIEIIEAQGQVREHIREFGEGVRRSILESCGRVHLGPEEITNRGNLTRAVMDQLYQPIIRATEAKRVLYGEDGYCKVFELAYAGLKKLGKGNLSNKEVDVQIIWPDFFPMQTADKQELSSYLIQLVEKGAMTQAKFIETIASVEGIQDLDQFKKDLAVQAKEQARAAQKDAEENNGTGYSFRSRGTS